MKKFQYSNQIFDTKYTWAGQNSYVAKWSKAPKTNILGLLWPKQEMLQKQKKPVTGMFSGTNEFKITFTSHKSKTFKNRFQVLARWEVDPIQTKLEKLRKRFL